MTRVITLACAFVLLLAAEADAHHAHERSIVYAFQGGADGGDPVMLTADHDGTLYGVTGAGGSPACKCGTVFKVTPEGVLTTLHTFELGTQDGQYPSGIALGPRGNIFGTTVSGGPSNGGTVFELTPEGKFKILFGFGSDHLADGYQPLSGLLRSSDGNYYGTTSYGGGSGTCGCGTVFKISSSGAFNVIHSFTGDDGWRSNSDVIQDASGNLYGTTQYGGAFNNGTLFKIDTGGVETVLHSFAGEHGDGAHPMAPPVLDAAGNLYGGTTDGPDRSCAGGGCGIVYKVAPDGTETVLYKLISGKESGPFFGVYGALSLDGHGTLYGTTAHGGAGDVCNYPLGCGTVFEIRPDGKRKTLTEFLGSDQGDGAYPLFGLVPDPRDRRFFYGTTQAGPLCGQSHGAGCGMIFRIRK